MAAEERQQESIQNSMFCLSSAALRGESDFGLAAMTAALAYHGRCPMTPLRPRFRLEALEDRLTPVSPADVFNAVAFTRVHTAALDNTFDNPGLYTIATNAPTTRAAAASIEAQAEAAAGVLSQFMADLAKQIQANPTANEGLQVYLNEAAAFRLQALTNQGAAQLIVNFVDTTNSINAAGQQALAAAIIAQQTANNSANGTGTAASSASSTSTTNTSTSGIPQSVLNSLNGT